MSGRPTAVVAQEYATLYPSYGINVPLGFAYPDKRPVAGVFDPSFTAIDFTNKFTAAPGIIKRYGHGMARPILQDLSVLPAISVVPDPEHNLMGTKGEEGQEFPNDQTLKILNMQYPQAGLDLQDYQFLWNFSEYVVGPLNRGLPIGTPRANWPTPAPYHPPTTGQQDTVQVPSNPSSPSGSQAVGSSVTAPLAAPALDLQTLISQAIAQVVPALITAEIARLMPKGSDTGTPVQSGQGPGTSTPPPVNVSASTIPVAVLAAADAAKKNANVSLTATGGGMAMLALRTLLNVIYREAGK